jgi:uncharacterized protein (TIGR02118 family)
MIKVSVMYPYKPDARFDTDYYANRHMPMLKELMGPACLYYSVDHGVSAGRPGTPAAYVAMCHIHCDSVEAFNASFGPHAKKIMADLPNYTDLQPIMQVSEVLVERG